MVPRQAASHDDRIAPRDETWRRVRVSDEIGLRLPVLVVNLSPHGLMARVDEAVIAGSCLILDLPYIGQRRTTVRWSLGGRIGCKFDVAIPPDDYADVLAMMR